MAADNRFAEFVNEPDPTGEEVDFSHVERMEEEEDVAESVADLFDQFDASNKKEEEKEEEEEVVEVDDEEEEVTDEEDEEDEEVEEEEDVEEEVEEEDGESEEDDEEDEDNAEEEEVDEAKQLLLLQNKQLQDHFQTLQAELAALKTQREEEAKKAEEAAKTPPAAADQTIDPANLPAYSYQIPQEIVAALGSEDPQQNIAAITNLFNGFAAITHQRVMREAKAVIDNVVETKVPEKASSVVQQIQTQQDMRKDYFSSYPNHDKPEIHGFVSQATNMVFDAYRRNGIVNPVWDDKLRDAIASTTEKLSGIAGKAASVSAKGKKARTASKKKSGKKRKRTARIRSGTARRSGGKGKAEPSLSDEVVDLFK
jgi:hypothetical protein